MVIDDYGFDVAIDYRGKLVEALAAENAYAAFMKLLNGANAGKLILKIA